MTRCSVSFMLGLMLASCGPTVRPPPLASSSAEAGAWVSATLAQMDLREKVGQMMMPWIGGNYLAVDSDGFDGLREWVEVDHIGGLIVSIGSPMEVATKLNMVQELADVPLLITADMEAGPGQRLDGGVTFPSGLALGGGTRFPPIMALGAADDEDLAYEVGRITALEARAAGVHVTFAPVVDVNNNPANPIINTRSYGEDPERVAAMATAHVRGLQEHGLLSTAKHFPGHGDTELDSHLVPLIIPVDRARADSVELLPFRAAIEAGVAGVMSAHISFPAIAGDSLPATLSPQLLTGLLREELGFDGLVFTDAMDMGAIVAEYGVADAAVMAVAAGADVVLMPPDLEAAIAGLVDAVEDGQIPEERIDRSVERILRAKTKVGLHQQRQVSLEQIPQVVGRRDHRAAAQRIAERAVTVVRDRESLLPVNPTTPRRPLSIVFADDFNPVTGRVFQQALRERMPGLETAFLDARATRQEIEEVLAQAREADLVFFSSFVRVVAYRGDAALPEIVAGFVTELASTRPTVVASFGNPYLLDQFPTVGTYVLAWGPEDVAQQAAVSALTGEIEAEGRLPISLPPHHARGTAVRSESQRTGPALGASGPDSIGMDSVGLARVDSILADAVASGVAPGIVVAIGRHGKLVRLEGHGRLDLREGFGPVNDSTIYDIASLTKVVATTTAAMVLEEEGRLDLDSPLSAYLPEWGSDEAKERVTVRHLLTHTAGLPAYAPLWRDLRGREEFLRRIAGMDLEYTPGARTVYSDFGMILLALALERITGMHLDAFLEERVFRPLGMHDTGFNPLGTPPEATLAAGVRANGSGGGEEPPSILERIAPTELDTIFRDTHVHGVVHDENAYALGGVAGHAGAFSSARDLATFCQMLLNGGAYGSETVLQPATIQRFTRRQGSHSSRALGWDTASGPSSSAGDYFSERAFGHTGFTGPSIWIDPERDVFVVLLMNRVNPTRDNTGHASLRREVHDAVQRAIVDTPVERRPDAR